MSEAKQVLFYGHWVKGSFRFFAHLLKMLIFVLPLYRNLKIFNFDTPLIINRQILTMQKAVRLQVRKDLDPQQQVNIIKLKGSLISKGYTEIIHILDQDEEFHINTFETLPEQLNEVQQYIAAFINAENLTETVSIK